MKAFHVFVRSNSTMRAMTCHRGASKSACSFTLCTAEPASQEHSPVMLKTKLMEHMQDRQYATVLHSVR